MHSRSVIECSSVYTQEIDELCDEWVPEPLIPPITEDMKHEPPVLERWGGKLLCISFHLTFFLLCLKILLGSFSAAGPHTTVNGKDVVNFASANYLGLIGHEKLMVT